eukprot:4295664-Pyramimonas_sp.AAC.1
MAREGAVCGAGRDGREVGQGGAGARGGGRCRRRRRCLPPGTPKRWQPPLTARAAAGGCTTGHSRVAVAEGG